jgi:hypothetical protein
MAVYEMEQANKDPTLKQIVMMTMMKCVDEVISFPVSSIFMLIILPLLQENTVFRNSRLII